MNMSAFIRGLDMGLMPAQMARLLSFVLVIPAPAAIAQSASAPTDPMIEMRDASRAAWNALPDVATGDGAKPSLRVIRPALFSHMPPVHEVEAPNHGLIAGTQAGALYVRKSGSDDVRIVARPDGTGRWDIEGAQWSPDGRLLVVRKLDDSAVPRIVLRGAQFGPMKVREAPYSRVGEPLVRSAMFIVDVATGKAVPIRHGTRDPYVQTIEWSPDGRQVRFLQADRYVRQLRLQAADAATGDVRLLHAESAPVSVVGLNILDGFVDALRAQKIAAFLPDGSFVWTSDASGYRHLYLYGPDGRLKRRLTLGRIDGWVDRVVDVDADRGVLYVKANGHATDPYFERLLRVDLNTNRVDVLAEADHIANIKFSSDRSKVWLATAGFPATRNIIEVPTSGGPARIVWQGDFDAARAKGWSSPELVMVPAADGMTPLRALVLAPYPLEPGKRYPVIQNIYGGPSAVWVPPSPINNQLSSMTAYARAGFVVVMVDGRGTPSRGRAFQNFGYGRWGQVEPADQVAALRTLAKSRPYMDLDRVGVVGGSWGGYFGLRTMLMAPDLYKAGAFGAGAFELATMRVSAEPYMGCGLRECAAAYRAGSNFALLERLHAPLQIMHGTADDDVPIEESLRLVDALKRLGKPYEFLPLEGATHALGAEPRVDAAHIEFFRKHLGAH